MLVHCHLNGMSCLFLLKGQLHSVTLKVFGRHYGLKEEFNGLNMSVGLSTSRHNFIPHGRTTSFRVYTNISNSRFESRAPPAPAPKSSPMRGSVVESPNARMP